MSGFDPMLNAKLNRHIRECEPGSGGGGGQTVIDLSQFSTGEYPYNIALLMLFGNGGGSYVFGDPNGFWDAVNSENSIKFIIDTVSLGAIVEAEAQSVMKNTDGRIDIIETSFLAQYSGTYNRVTVVFERRDWDDGHTDTGITVVVDTLTVPEYNPTA